MTPNQCLILFGMKQGVSSTASSKLDKEILDEFISFIKKYTKLNTNNLTSEDIKNEKINNNKFLIINKDFKKRPNTDKIIEML